MARKGGWSRRFDDPIRLRGGCQLVTLKDAAHYIMKRPRAEQNHEHWQTAIHCLIGAAESRDFIMHAEIAMLRALNHGKPDPATTPRKRTKAYRIVR